MGKKVIRKYEMPTLAVMEMVQNLCVGGSNPGGEGFCTDGTDIASPNDDCDPNGSAARNYCTNGRGAQMLACMGGYLAGDPCADGGNP